MTTTTTTYTPEQVVQLFTERWAGIFDGNEQYFQEEFHRLGVTEQDFSKWLAQAHPVTEKF